MALPKSKHLRKITVDGTEYYWKVEEDTRDYRGLIVTVGVVAKPYKRFIFDFRFSYNHTNDDSHIIRPAITAVTPNLIKQSIAFAYQKANWEESKKCFFKFKADQFQLVADEGD